MQIAATPRAAGTDSQSIDRRSCATINGRTPNHQSEEIVDTQKIVSELKAKRNRLDKAIAALDGASTSRATVAKNVVSMSGAKAPRKRHHLTAAGRKRLSILMKKRWSEKRKKAS